MYFVAMDALWHAKRLFYSVDGRQKQLRFSELSEKLTCWFPGCSYIKVSGSREQLEVDGTYEYYGECFGIASYRLINGALYVTHDAHVHTYMYVLQHNLLIK